MAFESKQQYQSRPSSGKPAAKTYSSKTQTSTGEKKPGKRPTHYLKNKENEFVNQVGIWFSVDKFGNDTFQVKVNEALEPGTYFMKAVRTDKAE